MSEDCDHIYMHQFALYEGEVKDIISRKTGDGTGQIGYSTHESSNIFKGSPDKKHVQKCIKCSDKILVDELDVIRDVVGESNPVETK